MASSKVGDAAATQVQIRELGLKGRWEEALNLLNSLSSSGCMVEAVTYSATMWTCVKNQQWQQALKLFKDMREHFLAPETVSCNAALCAYEQAGRWEDALVLLQDMRESEVVDVISYTAVMNVCADAGQCTQTLRVHRSMLQDGHPPTADTCNAAIRSCDGPRWREQLELLQEMRRRGLQPNATALNAAVCRSSEAGQWRCALQLMSSMWERGFQPDAEAFREVISACEQCGESEEALRLFRLRQSYSAAPENETYAAAIRACGGSKWNHALELLTKRWETGVADAQCYDSAIACCEAAERWDEVLRLFDEMQSYKLKPGKDTLIAVASASAATASWQRSLELLEHCKDSAEVVGRVASACADAKQWQRVLDLLEEVRPQQRPNLQLYQAALKSCGDAGRWEDALQLLQEVRLRGFHPSVDFYNSAMTACAAAQRWGDLHGLFEEVQNDIADAESYRLAMEACNGLQCQNNVVELLRSAEEQGISLTPVMFNMALKACGTKQNWAAALEILGNMRQRGEMPDREASQCITDLLLSRAREHLFDEKWRYGMQCYSEFENRNNSIFVASATLRKDCANSIDPVYGAGF
ncbi:unnamed protein product [Cladocopium goreaui]|uniref:Pentatricopeptide repeat-containing protein At2g18940, chloroplastic n=1 Tax=Cladocopium goreaui TaxID=2562237 RepID=A0A9P1BWZ7_9DINO|nr:unnamed protein product [Cladocopium goreaui]